MKAIDLSQKISYLAEKDFTTLNEDLTIDVAAKIMQDRGSSSILVIDNRSSKPTGIITERDILYRVVAENRVPSRTELKKLISSPLITIDKESSMKDAISLMMEKGIRRLPVIQGDNIIGMVNMMSLRGHVYEEKTDVSSKTDGSTLNILVKDTILTCPYCQSIFKDKAEMSKHIDRIHLGSGLLEGDIRQW
jgi:CBS domain-containing protein